jgi:anthranilate synthase component 2
MKILLIDNNDSFTYNLVQLVRENGQNELEVINYHKLNSKIIQSFDKIIISPGPGLPEDFPMLEKWIQEFAKTKSILGICMGHESIALAYGGKLEKQTKVFHGISKLTSAVISDEYLFDGIAKHFETGLYHSWAIDPKSFPEELIVTAKANDGIIMGLSHRKYDVKGLQFHPESIMTPVGEKMISNWLNH